MSELERAREASTERRPGDNSSAGVVKHNLLLKMPLWNRKQHIEGIMLYMLKINCMCWRIIQYPPETSVGNSTQWIEVKGHCWRKIRRDILMPMTILKQLHFIQISNVIFYSLYRFLPEPVCRSLALEMEFFLPAVTKSSLLKDLFTNVFFPKIAASPPDSINRFICWWRWDVIESSKNLESRPLKLNHFVMLKVCGSINGTSNNR